MSFSLGQRWISDTESDLGLGTVVACEGRQVSILFPASGENRVYSASEAPVTRVIFNVGDTIRSAEQWEITVENIEHTNGLLTYIGKRTDNEELTELRETQLDHFIKFNKPQDKLFSGQIDRFDRFSLRYQTLEHLNHNQQSSLKGLVGARASLIPHQLYIAEEVAKRFAPRVLLSDEVGLGKTIEAGMIIHQQILTGRAQRVLIIVPENLQHQWLVEMLRRFNLHFSIFDEERCNEAYADAANPFETEQLILTSLEFISKKKTWFEQATLADWDLLVVDEAHHLTWNEQQPSTQYTRIAELSNDIPGLILLTATPDQLGHESHFARLKLLDENRFYNYQAFVEEENRYQHVADAANQLLANHALDKTAKNTLQALLNESDISPLLAQAETGDVAAVNEILSMLLDRHGTGRILFRNSRSSIQGFPKRKLHAYPIEMPKQYTTAIKVMGNIAGLKDADMRAKRALFPEKIFQEFEADAISWTQFDPRVKWLSDKLLELKREKVLVICSEAQTALNLEQILRESEGIKAAVFHEGLSIIERDRAAAYFAEQDNSAQVLLCSEIGSEGRNFQFSHHLILFDLPLNPDLLEQRIGRLDRIGQKNDINIHVPYFINTAQEVLFKWYHNALQAFEYTLTTGQVLYSEHRPTLLELVAEHTTDDAVLAPFLQTVYEQNQALKEKMEQGRDRLLELHSKGQGRSEQLMKDIEELDNQTLLPMFMFKIFDIFGIAQADRGENAIVLKPTEHMLTPSFPCLRDEGLTVTFDRNTALAQEDVHFISWDHPMVQDVMSLVIDDDIGTTSVALLKNKQLPAGSFFVELIYLAETSAPKALQMGRFFPSTPVRLLLDKNGNDLAQNVAFDAFNQQLNAVGKQTASKLATALQTSVHPLIEKANELAKEQLASLKANAKQKVEVQLVEELDRLKSLMQINPSVREDEVNYLATQKATLHEHAEKAELKLDSIRLIVVSH